MVDQPERRGGEDVPGSGAGGATDPAGPPALPRRRRSDTTPRQRRRQQRAWTGGAGEPGVVAGDDRRRRGGRRTAARRSRRRRSRLRTFLGIVVLTAAAVGLVVLAAMSGLVERARELVAPDDPAATAELPADERQPAVAVITTDDEADDARAHSITVLAYDRELDEGTVLLVPAATVADVPGHGTFTVGEAYTFGEGPLVAVTLDNLLGIHLDTVVTVSRQGWEALLSRIDGFEVDVRSRLVARDHDGAGEVRFEAGEQFLDGPRLAEYLTFRDEDETQLESLPRVQQVVAGLLDVIAGDEGAIDRLFEDDAPMLDTVEPDLLRSLLAELADARVRERVSTLTLPVSPLGSGRDDLYRVDAPRMAQLVDDRFAGSRPDDATGAGTALQILNGNGIQGASQDVAERLQPAGYRVVLTGNADRFDYDETRIVVYDDTDAQLAVAADIQERLGTGRIERSGTPQSVVDVTIVVGHDFPPDS